MSEVTSTLPRSMTAAPMSIGPIDIGEPCTNCAAPMQGPFCHACGQPKKGLIRHLSGIVADFFDTVFNIDSRTLRTIVPLYFRPGFLSNEYFAGRRVRYVTPLRLYFFLSVILFLVISLLAAPDGLTVRTDPASDRPAVTQAERDAQIAKMEPGLELLPEARRNEVRKELDAELRRDAERAVAERTWGPPAPPSVVDGARSTDTQDDEDVQIVFNGGKPWHKEDNPLTFSWLPDDLNRALNQEIEIIVGKAKSVRKDPKPFVEEVFSIAPQALFVILPIFALMLKIMYVFKRRLYMEHLIVALHSHSFLCLSILLLVGLSLLEEHVPSLGGLAKLLTIAAAVWMPLHLYWMQKRVYRQGYVLTTLKFGVIGVAYLFLLSFGLLATMVAGLIFL